MFRFLSLSFWLWHTIHHTFNARIHTLSSSHTHMAFHICILSKHTSIFRTKSSALRERFFSTFFILCHDWYQSPAKSLTNLVIIVNIFLPIDQPYSSLRDLNILLVKCHWTLVKNSQVLNLYNFIFLLLLTLQVSLFKIYTWPFRLFLFNVSVSWTLN